LLQDLQHNNGSTQYLLIIGWICSG